MKKAFSFVLLAALCISLCACNDHSNDWKRELDNIARSSKELEEAQDKLDDLEHQLEIVQRKIQYAENQK